MPWRAAVLLFSPSGTVEPVSPSLSFFFFSFFCFVFRGHHGRSSYSGLSRSAADWFRVVFVTESVSGRANDLPQCWSCPGVPSPGHQAVDSPLVRAPWLSSGWLQNKFTPVFPSLPGSERRKPQSIGSRTELPVARLCPDSLAAAVALGGRRRGSTPEVDAFSRHASTSRLSRTSLEGPRFLLTF